MSKVWVRVGIEIDIDTKDLSDQDKVLEAIRVGTIDGEAYIPNADEYEDVPSEYIEDGEIVYVFSDEAVCKGGKDD